MPDAECVFCQIVAGKAPAQKEWESEDFLVIANKYPNAPVHLLVMPKAHESKQKLAKEDDGEFWGDLMSAAFEVIRLKGLDKSGYKLVNNGAGYNHFDHEHMHVMEEVLRNPEELLKEGGSS